MVRVSRVICSNSNRYTGLDETMISLSRFYIHEIKASTKKFVELVEHPMPSLLVIYVHWYYQMGLEKVGLSVVTACSILRAS
jgi:hypothetical protein